MAWGYWTAHTLAPSHSRPRSLSPGPGPMVRSRDHSLDRDRAANIGKLCHTPESGGSTRCHSSGHSGEHSGHSHSSAGPSAHVSPGSGRDCHQHSPGHRDLDWAETGHRPDRTKDRDRDPHRDRDRNTLPRVKMETESCVSSGHGSGSGAHVQSAGPGVGSVMVEQRHTLPRGRTECESHGWPEPPRTKRQMNSEGEAEADWCPGCNNASCPVSNVSSCR